MKILYTILAKIIETFSRFRTVFPHQKRNGTKLLSEELNVQIASCVDKRFKTATRKF